MAAEALIAESTRTLAVSWRIWDFIVVFRRFAPDWFTVHRFLQQSRGNVTKFMKLSWEPVLKMGGAGDPPAPVGDPPTGTAASNIAMRRSPLARTVAPVPSGESPDGTGGSPVLPANHISNTLLARLIAGPPCHPIHQQKGSDEKGIDAVKRIAD